MSITRHGRQGPSAVLINGFVPFFYWRGGTIARQLGANKVGYSLDTAAKGIVDGLVGA